MSWGIQIPKHCAGRTTSLTALSILTFPIHFPPMFVVTDMDSEPYAAYRMTKFGYGAKEKVKSSYFYGFPRQRRAIKVGTERRVQLFVLWIITSSNWAEWCWWREQDEWTWEMSRVCYEYYEKSISSMSVLYEKFWIQNNLVLDTPP